MREDQDPSGGHFEDMIQNGVGRIGGERRAKEGLRNTLFEKYS